MKNNKKFLLLMAMAMLASALAFTACASKSDIDEDLLGELNVAIGQLGEAEGMDVTVSAKSNDGSEGQQLVQYEFKGNNTGSHKRAVAACSMSAKDSQGKGEKGRFYIKDKWMYSDLADGKRKHKLRRGSVCRVLAMPYIVDLMSGVEIAAKEVQNIRKDDGLIELEFNKDKVNKARSIPQGMEDAKVVGRYSLSNGSLSNSEVTISSKGKTLVYSLQVNKVGPIDGINIPDNLDDYDEAE